MSEYWVSKARYYCKYCSIYIADDKPSRVQHETGLRHKGNYDRYITQIYKKGEKDQRDKAEESREIARMEAAANLAMVADGMASTSTAPPPRRSRPVASSSSDPYANYSTAESLGFIDADAERCNAELEARKNEGRIGEWERVVKPPPVPAAPEWEPIMDNKEEEVEVKPVEKKPADYFDKEKTRELRDDEMYDPSKVGIKLKRKRLTLQEEEALREEDKVKAKLKREKREEEDLMERKRKRAATTTSGWAEVQLEKEPILMFEEGVKGEEGVKEEEEGVVPAILDDVEQVVEVAAPAGGGGLFKKRKMLGKDARKR